MIPVSAPPRVRSRLRNAPDGPVQVLHRGLDAIYVDVGGWCVGTVSHGATALPCALRTSVSTLPEVTSVMLRGGVLHLDRRPLKVGRLVDVAVPALRGGARAAGEEMSSHEVAGLIGSGDGLTPYGDDVLCGWLAVHRSAGVETPGVDAAVRDNLGRTTTLSATLLDCALHGEVIPEFAAYVAALGSPHDEHTAAAALEAVGHTSGHGLLEGARRALEGLGRAAA